MKIQLRLYLYLLLIFVICSDAFAQNNRAYNEVQTYRKANTKNRIAKLRDIPKEDYLADMGYDSTDVANLEKIGIHIDSLSRKGILSEKEKTIRAECIVIGTVIAVEHPKPLPRGGYADFGTTAYVNAEEFLRNDYDLPKGPIPIMIESGPYMRVFSEDTLRVGEHVLLFLSSTYMLNSAERYNPDFYQKAINDSTIKFRIIGYHSKYIIESGKIFNRWIKGSRDFAEVREEILNMVAKLHYKDSTIK